MTTAEERREYQSLRRRFLLEHPQCQVGKCRELALARGETGIREDWVASATHVHHVRGRYQFFLDSKTWLAVCADCHDYIHANSLWATEQGYMGPRYLTTEEKEALRLRRLQGEESCDEHDNEN